MDFFKKNKTKLIFSFFFISSIFLGLYYANKKYNFFDDVYYTKIIIGFLVLVFLIILTFFIIYYKNREVLVKKITLEDKIQAVYEDFYRLLKSTWNMTGFSVAKVLYSAPWYLVLGEAGVGKSKIIEESDLTFEKVDEVREINKKIAAHNGGVEFFLSKESVIIEKSNSSDDSKSWLLFLSWLKDKRKSKPLNGVVVTLDVERLIKLSEDERREESLSISKDLTEMNDVLGVRLPVYVVLTKTDLLDGFLDFYKDISSEERDSVLGLTFPFHVGRKSGDFWLTDFTRQYDSLIKHLNQSLNDKLIDESVSAKNYLFIRQMIGLKSVLQSFLNGLCNDSGYSTYPLLRGIFFTSTTQQSLAFNAVGQSISSYFKLPDLIYSPRKGFSKNFFIKRLFARKIIPESGLTGDSFYALREEKKTTILQYLVCGLLVTAASSAWSYYYQTNKKSAHNVLVELEKYSNIDGVSSRTPLPESYLEPLSILKGAINEYGEVGESSNSLSDLGLYKGERISPKVVSTYESLISDGFFRSIIQDLLTKGGTVNADNSLEGFKTLRVVRLISESAKQDGLSKEERDELIRYKRSIVIPFLEARWQRMFAGQAAKQNALMEHLVYGLEEVGVELNFADKSRLQSLQNRLSKVSLPMRLYNQLRIESEYELGEGISLRHEVGGGFDELFNVKRRQDQRVDGLTIPALFTYEGFNDFYISRYESIMSMAALDTWAMGRSNNPISFSDADIRRFQSNVNEIYLDEYKKVWLRAINSINLVSFGNDIGLTVKKLNSLSVSDSPYRSILKALSRNTILDNNLTLIPSKTTEEKDDVDGEKVLASLIPEKLKTDITVPLKKYFNSYNNFLTVPKDRDTAYIDDIETSLSSLYAYMLDLQQNLVLTDEKGYALKKAMERLDLKSDEDPFYLLYRLSSGLKEPMRSQLQKISKESWNLVLVEASKDLNEMWRADVYRFYEEKIRGRYPFDRNSQQEVSPDDFKEFFEKDGIADTFYKDHLVAVLEKGSVSNESSILISSSVSDFFKHLKAIQQGLFTSKGEYGVAFSVEATDLSGSYLNSVINIDGVSISYHHAKSPVKDMIWPNQLGVEGRSFIRLTPLNRSMNSEMRSVTGSWSLLRLLDMATTTALSTKTREVSFPFKAGRSNFKLRVSNDINPITRDLFSGFRVPTSISNTRFTNQ